MSSNRSTALPFAGSLVVWIEREVYAADELFVGACGAEGASSGDSGLLGDWDVRGFRQRRARKEGGKDEQDPKAHTALRQGCP